MSEPLLIRPKAEDIAGQPILRPLPSAKCRSVGPFVFFDHMLEKAYPAGSGMNINQHPHIGLSTLTYLFEGALQHKDSLGSDQLVRPGDVSWMTAGRAVAHVERTPENLWQSGSHLHGLQVWLALPQEMEEGEPSYSHHSAASLPRSESMGVHITLIAGSGFCLESPVPMHSPTLYAELKLAAGASLLIPAEHRERALYLIEGEAQLEGADLPLRGLAVLPEGEELLLTACGECHLALIGGEPLGPRRMYWNFVASDAALLEKAKQNWAAWDWPRVPGETERIDLPGT
ncbi:MULTISPECIES: pirin family protein [unclassified Pseudomonas]|uniref:pirin family protein n=1 Tax=unclassified Pseudomonas TaxID=196821 RepID=UPI002446FABC|nr:MULTISPECIES: pirin family protein [unclassified Pseudomonas]MDG9923050.1 pirin family protein [Pseudomonas sp. GD04045]MDH0035586.1 pirin family protein [Pseudomonas sp. GD04019]